MDAEAILVWETVNTLTAITILHTDLALDVVLCLAYRDDHHQAWFIIIIATLIIAAIITSLLSSYLHKQDDKSDDDADDADDGHIVSPTRCVSICRYVLHLSLLPLISRSVELLISLHRLRTSTHYSLSYTLRQPVARPFPYLTPYHECPGGNDRRPSSMLMRERSFSCGQQDNTCQRVRKWREGEGVRMLRHQIRCLSELHMFQAFSHGGVIAALHLYALLKLSSDQHVYDGEAITLVTIKLTSSLISMMVASSSFSSLPDKLHYEPLTTQLAWWFYLKPLHFVWHSLTAVTRLLAVATFTLEFQWWVLVLLAPTMSIFALFRWYIQPGRPRPVTRDVFTQFISFYVVPIKDDEIEVRTKTRQGCVYLVYYMLHVLVNSIYMLPKYAFGNLRQKHWFDSQTLLVVQILDFVAAVFMVALLATKACCHLNTYKLRRKPDKDEKKLRFEAEE